MVIRTPPRDPTAIAWRLRVWGVLGKCRNWANISSASTSAHTTTSTETTLDQMTEWQSSSTTGPIRRVNIGSPLAFVDRFNDDAGILAGSNGRHAWRGQRVNDSCYSHLGAAQSRDTTVHRTIPSRNENRKASSPRRFSERPILGVQCPILKFVAKVSRDCYPLAYQRGGIEKNWVRTRPCSSV